MYKKFICTFICSLSLFASVIGYEYKLSIGMIFNDEAPYLKEWIEYHKLVGVEHFYLFNHHSTDNYKQVLTPYISKGIVELLDAIEQADFNGTQVDCYNRTLIKAYGKSKWVAMIDSDEFLVTPEGIKITDVLKKLDTFGGVSINWRCFGTSNVAKIPQNQLMIENLTQCARPEHPCNHMVKSIVRPERVRFYGGPHWPEYVAGWYSVDTDGMPYIPPTGLYKTNKLWINHYWTRDDDFLQNIKIPRSLAWGRSKEGMLESAQELNATTDTCILRHVPKLKEIIFKENKKK